MRKARSLKHNIFANFVGKALVSILSLLFLPLYIRLLGIEAYGLIGFYTSIVAMIGVLDFGLSTVLNRELARLSASTGTEQSARDLTYTLEFTYWIATIIISTGCVAVSPYIAHHWLHASTLSPATVAESVAIMGLILVFQWPDSLYAGGLMGLQRQVLLNSIRVVVAVLQTAGAALILLFVSRSIQAFFIWQIVICAVQTFLLRRCLWAALPETGQRSRIDPGALKANWRFAVGVSGTTLMSTVITQSDKAILSRLLTLQMFGYYALASQLANALTYLFAPIFTAIFPRLSQLAAGRDTKRLTQLYHLGCQALALILLPAWAVVVLFPSELLSLYLHDPTALAQVRLFLIGLITGVAINALVILPNSLQLACGWTGLGFYKTAIAAACSIPLLFWMIDHYGPVGASFVRAIVNVGYMLIEIPIMHRRLLKGEMWHWYLVDVGLPVAVSFGICGAGRLLFPHHASPYLVLLGVPAIFILAVCSTAGALPAIRRRLTTMLASRRYPIRNE